MSIHFYTFFYIVLFCAILSTFKKWAFSRVIVLSLLVVLVVVDHVAHSDRYPTNPARVISTKNEQSGWCFTQIPRKIALCFLPKIKIDLQVKRHPITSAFFSFSKHRGYFLIIIFAHQLQELQDIVNLFFLTFNLDLFPQLDIYIFSCVHYFG